MKNPQNATFIVVFIDVWATAAALVGTTVHQVSPRRTVSNHKCVDYLLVCVDSLLLGYCLNLLHATLSMLLTHCVFR